MRDDIVTVSIVPDVEPERTLGDLLAMPAGGDRETLLVILEDVLPATGKRLMDALEALPAPDDLATWRPLIRRLQVLGQELGERGGEPFHRLGWDLYRESQALIRSLLKLRRQSRAESENLPHFRGFVAATVSQCIDILAVLESRKDDLADDLERDRERRRQPTVKPLSDLRNESMSNDLELQAAIRQAADQGADVARLEVEVYNGWDGALAVRGPRL